MVGRRGAARGLLLRAVADKLDADQRVRLFRSSPFEKATWLIVDEYGDGDRQPLLEGSASLSGAVGIPIQN